MIEPIDCDDAEDLLLEFNKRSEHSNKSIYNIIKVATVEISQIIKNRTIRAAKRVCKVLCGGCVAMANMNDKIGGNRIGCRARMRFMCMSGRSLYCPAQFDCRTIMMISFIWTIVLFIIYAGRYQGGVYVVSPHTLGWDQNDYKNGWTYNEAFDACAETGSRIATITEVRAAYDLGFDYCLWVWATDTKIGPENHNGAVAVIATRDTSAGCNNGGVNEGSRNHFRRFYPVCYGDCPPSAHCTLI